MQQSTRRPPIPLGLRLYVGGVALAACLVLPASHLAAGTSHGVATPLAALLLAGMIGWADRRPIQIGLKRRLSVSTAPQLVTILLLPGELALATLIAGRMLGYGLPGFGGREAGRTPIIQHIFNYAVLILRGGLGLLVFAGTWHVCPPELRDPVAAVLAALTLYLTGNALVLGIAALQLRENPLRRSWAGEKETAVAEGTLSLTAIMAWLATLSQPWALPMLVAPLGIAHYALRDGVALRAQTRLALEELADIVDMRDHYTFEHSRRVAELARATARRLGLANAEVELITMAGRVHDVGKIGIKSSVLMKPGGLTDPEWQEMRSHPEVGAKLIGNFPQFAKGRAYVRHHHERYDGKGYPKGLAGEQIPLGARVLAVADAWDAMTSHRAYRKALDLDHVYGELERGRGKQFDPAVLEAFLQVLAERPDLAVIHVETTQDVDAPAPAAPRPEGAAPRAEPAGVRTAPAA